MKTYIPKQPKHVRERIEAKLDARLVERLEKYCLYLESDRDYVLAQALEMIFRKDRGFSEWLAGQGAEAPSMTNGRPVHKEQTSGASPTRLAETSAPAAAVPPASRG